MPLMPPDMGKLKKILPDGNCMFRSLSYIVTGSEDHYQTVRAKIVEHSKEAPSLPNCWDTLKATMNIKPVRLSQITS